MEVLWRDREVPQLRNVRVHAACLGFKRLGQSGGGGRQARVLEVRDRRQATLRAFSHSPIIGLNKPP